MEELLANLHIHSAYSDGTGSHQEIAKAGLDSAIDVLIITDHNVLVDGVEGYYFKGKRSLLLLCGEEINDKSAIPPKNHLLAFGQSRELCHFAESPQTLINQVQRENGLSFLAHPFEDSMDFAGESANNWLNWDVTGFHGIELWNHLSELKSRTSNWFQLLFYVFYPNFYTTNPNPLTLKKWDQLTTKKRKVVAIGGSDAHALKMRKGLLKKIIFPYPYHFRCINTHILVPRKLTGDIKEDKPMVLDAFRQGHVFVGYDLPASTGGFRFYAQGKNLTALMGDEILIIKSITLHIHLPAPAECRLILDGQMIKVWTNQEICTYIANDPGVYRVEVYINYLGKNRGWIFSNPIYVNSQIND